MSRTLPPSAQRGHDGVGSSLMTAPSAVLGSVPPSQNWPARPNHRVQFPQMTQAPPTPSSGLTENFADCRNELIGVAEGGLCGLFGEEIFHLAGASIEFA